MAGRERRENEEKAKLCARLRAKRTSRRDVISIDDNDDDEDEDEDEDDVEIEERKSWRKRRFYCNVYRPSGASLCIRLCKYASTISCVKRTLSFFTPPHPLPPHVFHNIYVRRAEEKEKEEEEKGK